MSYRSSAGATWGVGEPSGPTTDALLAEYLSIVGHELRTPLSVIQIAAETLATRDDALTAEVRVQLATAILRNTRRAVALLARMEAAHTGAASAFDVTPEVFDVVALTRAMTDDLRHLVLAAHPTVVSSEEPVLVFADPNAVGEILENVLTNAAKYSVDDTSIEVSIVSVGDVVEIAVRDHGRGIDDATAQRVFDPRVRGSTDVVGEGLGLYLSRELARNGGGDVVLRAHGETGCNFVVLIPAGHAAPGSDNGAAGISPTSSTGVDPSVGRGESRA